MDLLIDLLGCTAGGGDMNHEVAGLANIEPITNDDDTVAALYPGAEGVAFWVDMLMVSPLSEYVHVNKLLDSTY